MSFHLAPSRPAALLVPVLVAVASLSAAFAVVRAFPMGGHGDQHGGTAQMSDPMPGFRLSGMPLAEMPEMFIGAAALLLLVVLSVRPLSRQQVPSRSAAPRWVPSTRLRVVALTLALAIDTSKTSSLGFVIPGMRAEYGLSPLESSMLPVAGLTGTTIGAVLVRLFVNRVERSRLFLLIALGFMLTSCCAMMPTFAGNLVMCLLMGVTVGGLAPVIVTALRECGGPSSGATLVVLGSVVGSALGFLIAATTASVLEPLLGWRVMWIIGVPTGLALLLSTPLFRAGEQLAGGTLDALPDLGAAPPPRSSMLSVRPRLQYAFAFVTGLTAFGLTVWTPTLVAASGAPEPRKLLVGVSLALLAAAVGLAAIQHSLGARWVLALTAGGTGVALVLLTVTGGSARLALLAVPALLVVLFGSNAMSSLILPVAAATQPSATLRGRFVAEVSVANRLGGLLGPPLLALLITTQDRMFWTISMLGLSCCVLAALVHQTSGRRRQGAVDQAALADRPSEDLQRQDEPTRATIGRAG